MAGNLVDMMSANTIMSMVKEVSVFGNSSDPMNKDSRSSFSSFHLIQQVLPAIIVMFSTYCIHNMQSVMPFLCKKVRSYAVELVHKWRSNLPSTTLQSIEIKYSVTATGEIIDLNNSHGSFVRRALIEFVTKERLFGSSSQFILGAGEASASNPFKYEQSRTKLLLPLQPVRWNEITIEFTDCKPESDSNNKDGRNCSVRLTSYTKTQEQIRDFISQQISTYNARFFDDSDSILYFYPYTDSSAMIRYKKYKFRSNKTFDTTFFPEKQRMLYLLDRMARKEKTKLSFLFHGAPGTGKTSTIKAIANLTKRHVVVVKLGQIKSDQQLMEVLHGETIRVKNDEIKLPISERIYVFEDVDAETDIVFKRSSSSSSSSSSCSPLSYSDPVHMNDKDMKSITTSIIKTEQLTLAGLLNALDGFLELYGAIVIVTTNHRNKLDPAFVRPGRIDMEIEFKTMQSVDAEHMIRRHFQLHETARMPFSIPNNAITPCLLESVLHQSSSLNDIEIILQKHNVLKAQESKGDEKKEDDNKHEEKEEKQRVVTPSKRKRKR